MAISAETIALFEVQCVQSCNELVSSIGIVLLLSALAISDVLPEDVGLSKKGVLIVSGLPSILNTIIKESTS